MTENKCRLLTVGCWLLAMAAVAQPKGVTLDTLQVRHVNLKGDTMTGTVICNRKITKDLREIFDSLYRAGYPIERITPIAHYGDNDERSMRANNTSCYCYRPVAGSKKLSKHALGLAIDINPLYNPCVRTRKDGSVSIQPATARKYAVRKEEFPYKIDADDLCVRLFKAHGFRWGGDWKTLKDWQHFEK